MEEEVSIGRRNVGKLNDNKIKDKEFAQRVLALGIEARSLRKIR